MKVNDEPAELFWDTASWVLLFFKYLETGLPQSKRPGETNVHKLPLCIYSLSLHTFLTERKPINTQTQFEKILSPFISSTFASLRVYDLVCVLCVESESIQ